MSQVWTAKGIGSERRIGMLKWYINKFPIPRRGLRVPRAANAEVVKLLGKEKSWSENKVWMIKDLVRTLRSCTSIPGRGSMPTNFNINNTNFDRRQS